jgi:serine/threonine-protein kinase
MSDGLGGRTDPLIGSVLDKDYLTIRRIGIGGMSVVYLVEHQRLKKQFAAKLLNAELAANPEAMARFETEAKAASSLEHENIVRVTDYGVATDGRPYIIMELLKGRTLDEQLVDQPLTLEESVLVIVSVCRGLALAHADGIVHRDIKPDNIYLTQRANGTFGVKILDFGIAKAPLHTGRVTKHGQTIGTPHYMAPEACRGEEVDHRADIYSVGVLMYLLFTGKLPHHDDNFLALLRKQVLDPVTPPSQINPAITPALEEVILHAIAKDADDRYVSVDHLLSEFELALPPGANLLLLSAARVSTPIPLYTPSSLPAVRSPSRTPLPAVTITPAPAPASLEPAAPPPRRSRLLLFALLGGVLVAGGIAAFGFATGSKPREPGIAVAAPTLGVIPTPAPIPAPHPGADPSPVARVKLKIATEPAHARVTLDGVELGRTPLELEVAPADHAALEIVADGYDAQTRTIALTSDQTLDLALVRKAPAHVAPVRDRPKAPVKTGSGSSAAPADTDLDIRMHR